jgi:hypothetical protein
MIEGRFSKAVMIWSALTVRSIAGEGDRQRMIDRWRRGQTKNGGNELEYQAAAGTRFLSSNPL